MMIFTDYNKPYILESLSGPIVPQYHWVFSGEMCDYTLAPITILESTTGPSIEFVIEGFTFILPCSWHIMIVDKETTQIDTIPVSHCARSNYTALLFSPHDSKMRECEIKVVDFHENASLVHPILSKGTMMCYPVGPELKAGGKNEDNILCINAGPYDLVGKILGDVTVADIIYQND